MALQHFVGQDSHFPRTCALTFCKCEQVPDSLYDKETSTHFAVPKCAAQQEIVRKRCSNSREHGETSTFICLPDTSLNRDTTTTLLSRKVQ